MAGLQAPLSTLRLAPHDARFHQGKLHEGYSQFFKMTPEQDAADRGSRIKQIGRWHDLARGRGVVICESESAEAVANWALNWNNLLDVDVVPVLG
jgi:hypothetical protein